jgi:hypothetical protein
VCARACMRVCVTHKCSTFELSVEVVRKFLVEILDTFRELLNTQFLEHNEKKGILNSLTMHDTSIIKRGYLQAPSETQNLAHCGNPAPNPPARRPEGEVVEGVYRRHPPAGAKEHPLRNANQQNGEHLRRRVRHPLKSCLFSQRGEPGDRADESIPRTRYGQADCWI